MVETLVNNPMVPECQWVEEWVQVSLGGWQLALALGAGMVAGEELMHHFTDGDKTSGGIVSNANAGDSWSDSNDMGGNDFGVTDSGSWDDGGGGDWT
jgi:hypothetical protein